ncbi:MAG: M4 family metallopeptidase [Bacteroidetes bacterium]|nr:M4 family metallopeptidase [Bacteroidota bacterium]
MNRMKINGTFIQVPVSKPKQFISKNEALQIFIQNGKSSGKHFVSAAQSGHPLELKWSLDVNSNNFICAYQFGFINENNIELIATVNAQNGELISITNHNCYIDVTGTAHTAYHGTKQIETCFTQNQYVLKTSSRGKGIETINLNGFMNYQSTTNFIDLDNYWSQSIPTSERYATDAHYCAIEYSDFLTDKLNRNSIDNNGQKLISYLNYGNGLHNAFWNGSAVVYGSGDSINTPLITLDVSGHEFTHGLIQKTANLNYSGAPGTLNEAIADILGTALEFHSDPQNANWTIGESSGTTLRNMADPEMYNQPDTYHGNHWYYGSGDNGGVHINSGFINKWFYLLANGGQGINDHGTNYQVTGIGINDAMRIIYHSLIAYLVPNSGYEDFKYAILSSAAAIFGTCSQQYLSSAASFQAVGLGQGINEQLQINVVGTTNFCEGDSVILSVKGWPGSTFTWLQNNLVVATGAAMQKTIKNAGIWMVSENRCGAINYSDSVSITVHSLPSVSTVNVSICEGQEAQLNGFPHGGNFNISNPYLGNSTSFEYSYTNNNGCTAIATGSVVVHEKPIVSIAPLNTIIPVNSQPLLLTGNVQGTFSGNAVNGQFFIPAIAGIGGPYPIYLNYSNSFGCSSIDSLELFVVEPCLTPESEVAINSNQQNIVQGEEVEFSLNVSELDYEIAWQIPDGCVALSPLHQAKLKLIWRSQDSRISAELVNTCGTKFTIEKQVRIGTVEGFFGVELFPVPATETITIKSSGLDSSELLTLRITDARGKLVKYIESITANETINIQELSAGFFFAEISAGSMIFKQRIVKY